MLKLPEKNVFLPEGDVKFNEAQSTGDDKVRTLSNVILEERKATNARSFLVCPSMKCFLLEIKKSLDFGALKRYLGTLKIKPV